MVTDNTPVELFNCNPAPSVISPAKSVAGDLLPKSVCCDMVCIFSKVTAALAILAAETAPSAIFAVVTLAFNILTVVTESLVMVVAKLPAVVVTAPVKAGKRRAFKVPVTSVPERSSAAAVSVCPDKVK